jgi:phosphate starvation-inducible PhoH-like protein
MGKKHVNNKSTHFVTANSNRIETKFKPRLTKDKDSITNGEQTIQLNNKQKAEVLIGKRILVKCKNKTQKDFVQMISEKEIILCKGPAGVGKSYLSVVQALHLLQSPDTMFEKIYIITPLIESDESVGYLKGSLADKMAPYLFSTYFLIDKLIGKQNREILVERNIIEPIAMPFLRGVNLENCIVIYEEAQNSSVKAMKTMLTRIGYNAKFIISGDLDQIDRYKNKKESGLFHAFEKLTNMDKIGLFEFTDQDIVRNPIISEILKRYDD